MSAKPRRTKRHLRSIQTWTYAGAQKVLPYLRSVLISLREHRLAALAARRDVKHWDGQPGRPDRHAIIAREEALARARLAQARLREAEEELETLSIYCLDPVNGLAVVPFVHREKLAWFIYDIFDEEPLQFWRYHGDSLDTRRPIKELEDTGTGGSMVA
jgi:hypothetical protein